MKNRACSVRKMRRKLSAQSSARGPCRFRVGFLLLPFPMWEEQQQRNLPVSTRRLKTPPIQRCSVMFWSTTKGGNKNPATAGRKKLLIGLFRPVSRSHRKAKPKKVAALPRKWVL